MAVDYVKCEAIQNANTRTRASLNEEIKRTWSAIMDAWQERDCGKKPSPMEAGYSTKALLAWYDCGTASRRVNDKKMQDEYLIPRAC